MSAYGKKIRGSDKQNTLRTSGSRSLTASSYQVKTSLPSLRSVQGEFPQFGLGKYASVGMTRNAQGCGGSGGSTTTPPGFYSPYHTPSAWQTPTTRKETYAWCLHPDMLITMSDYTQKKISDMCIGDMVVTHDGTHGKVTAISKRPFSGYLKKIELTGTPEPLLVTPEHNVFTVAKEDLSCKYFKSSFRFCREKYACTCKKCSDSQTLADRIDIKKIRSDELVSDDFMISPSSSLPNNREDFSPALMRLFGYYLAEGNIRFDERKEVPTPKSLVFSFGNHDSEIIEDAITTIKDEFDYNARIRIIGINGCVSSVEVYSTKLAQMFHDLLGHGAANKFASEKIMQQKIHLLKEMFFGYYLGDGHRVTNKQSAGVISIGCINLNILSQMKYILNALGANPCIHEHKSYQKNTGSKHRAFFLDITSFQSNYIIADCIIDNYKTIDKAREKNSARIFSCGENNFYRINNISDEAYEGLVYDLQVDNDSESHSFIANFAAVSNCTFFLQNEPIIGAAIDFYSTFPLTDFDVVCENAAIREYYEDMVKNLKISSWLTRIAREYWSMGDAFVLLDLNCPKCSGSNIDQETGLRCKHEGATWGNISVLDPNIVEVEQSTFAVQDPVITIVPDEQLQKICATKQPEPQYERLAEIPGLIEQILTGQPIVLDPMAITHLKCGSSPYATYGTSILRRLFTTLAYKDKLRQAQWMVVERHILPIKIVKIGNDNRPASSQDLADAEEQIAAHAIDPLVTIVTHHAFDFEWVGSCYDDQTEVLTENGFVPYYEVNANTKIACYDPKTGSIVYSPYVEKHEYDYDSRIYGDLYRFNGNHYDTCVTGNHKMLVGKRQWNNDLDRYSNEWMGSDASTITDHDRFKVSLDQWNGYIDVDAIKNIPIKDISLENYLKTVGYYISEGCSNKYRISIYQNEISPFFEDMRSTLEDAFGKSFHAIVDTRRDEIRHNDCWAFKVDSKKMAGEFSDRFGSVGYEKKLEPWMLQLPTQYLSILLDALMAGDGDIKVAASGAMSMRYSTTSKILADQVQEIIFKLGYNPKVSCEKRKCDRHHDIYRICWAKKASDRVVRSRNISRVPYLGKVWCFTTTTGYFVTRRNGKIGIHGNSGKILQLDNEVEIINEDLQAGLQLTAAIMRGEGPTYANAQVGLEALVKRLNTFRRELEQFIEEKIFKPVAYFNKFTHVDARGKETVVYPKFKFKPLDLKDNTQFMQLLFQLYQAGGVSLRTLLENMDLDPDYEIEQIRQEEMSAMLINPDLGLGLGEGGMGGGFGGGGMGGLGGGGGMPPMGGEAPAAPGGDMGAMDLGGGAPGGPMPMAANEQLRNYKNALKITRQASRNVKREVLAETSDGMQLREVQSDVTGCSYRGSLPEEMDIEMDPDWLPSGRDLTLTSYVRANQKVVNKLLSNVFGSENEDETVDTRMVIEAGRGGKGNDKQKSGRQKVLFTKIEQLLYKAVMTSFSNLDFYAQYIVGGNPMLKVDGAFPQLKIAVEADGETWHNSPEAIEKDRRRDASLAGQGWIVLRFTDSEIEGKINEVVKVIGNVINRRMQSSA